MKIYMAVTNDEYEFPVFICDKLRDLAKCVGKDETTISHRIKSHEMGIKEKKFVPNKKRGERKNYKYMKIDIDYDPRKDIIDGIDGNGKVVKK